VPGVRRVEGRAEDAEPPPGDLVRHAPVRRREPRT
jgi:hypothetical protein